MGTTLRAKFAIVTLALGLVALTPLTCEAGIAKNEVTGTAERGTRAGAQPTTVVSWELSGLVSLLRSGR